MIINLLASLATTYIYEGIINYIDYIDDMYAGTGSSNGGIIP